MIIFNIIISVGFIITFMSTHCDINTFTDFASQRNNAADGSVSVIT